MLGRTMQRAFQFGPSCGGQSVCVRGIADPRPCRGPDFRNHTYSQIIGNPDAPNFTALAGAGANIRNAPGDPYATNSGAHALRHPSQPNYLELYSGTNHGMIDNGYPGPPDEPLAPLPPFDRPNLGSALRNAGFSFATYSLNLPYAGFDGVVYTTDPYVSQYERKHNPVANWINATNPTGNYLPPSANQPFTTFQNIGASGGASPICPRYASSSLTSRTTCTMEASHRVTPG